MSIEHGAASAHAPVALPDALRPTFEALLGADLASVRVHPASPAAVVLGALAFARGDEIHCAPGAYDPTTREGWRVLAHEAAHVVQQRCGRVPARAGLAPLHDPLLEHEAHLAGALAVAAFDAGRLPDRPLYAGAIPARHAGASAVQCLMDQNAFAVATKAPGARDKISTVDRALAQFHALDSAKPRDYPKLLAQIRALYQACVAYKKARPDSKRSAGVDALVKQIAREEVLLVPLAAWATEPDALRKFEHLETAQELVLQLSPHGRTPPPDFTRKNAAHEVIELITANANVLRGAGATAAAIEREIDELVKLADRDTLPAILRSVIKECTAAANIRMMDKKIMKPGLMYNTTTGATQKYTLNHATEQYLGKKFRMGSLLHELTHCVIAETFRNTVVMLAIRPEATDEEMLALARSRNAKIARLQHLLKTAHMDEGLRKECIEKAGYATGSKFASYVGAFKPQLGDATFARLNNLVAQGLGSELVEYDTVINQMALWCCLWGMPESDPVVAELLALVKEAFLYRSLHRHASKPLPVPPARKTAGPPQRPLPALPPRR